MKTYAKKLLLMSTLTLGLIGGSLQMANATDLEINATAQARAAIELTEAQVMDFGIIDYLSTNGGTVALATNDAVTGGTDVTFDGTPAAGEVTVTGDGTSTADIACDATGTLGDGTNTIDLTAIEVVAGADNTIGVATGAANACVDTLTPSTTMDLATDDTIMVGGSLDLASTPLTTDGVYTTGAANGATVTLTVTYQ